MVTRAAWGWLLALVLVHACLAGARLPPSAAPEGGAAHSA